MRRHKGWLLLGIVAAIAVPITVLGRRNLSSSRRAPVAIVPEAQTVPTPSVPVPSAIEELSTQDISTIQSVISEQLAAFQSEDAETAFSYASPDIQQRFQTPQQFMSMVQATYTPVYQSQSANFEAIEIVQGQPVQAVTLLGPAGEWVTAYYQMERQTDKTWRIAGCVLVPLEGQTI
ncbi:MAG: DUF4864 domain-containing protein [Cyanobacteria bacterium P01_H01_bin.58]